MLVKALVRAVTPDVSGEFAKLVMETTNPLEILDIRVYTKNDTGKANIAALQSQVGKTILFPIACELYKGNIQYQIPFGERLNVAELGATVAKS